MLNNENPPVLADRRPRLWRTLRTAPLSALLYLVGAGATRDRPRSRPR